MESTSASAPVRPRLPVLLTFVALFLVAVAVVVRILLPFLAVILMALVAVGLLYQPFRGLVASLGGRRRLAAVAMCLLLMVAVLVPMFLTVQAVSREALGFYQMTTVDLTQHNMREMLDSNRETLERVNRLLAPLGLDVTPDEVYRAMGSLGVKLGGFFYRQGVALAKGLVRLVLGFFFWVVILYYLFVDGGALREWFGMTLPMPAEQQRLMARRFTDMANSLLLGNGLAGVIQGLAGGLVFAALDIPGPVLWGVVMAVLAFIPVIGISLVYLPVTLWLVLAGDLNRALLVFVPLVIISTVVEYWMKPALVGRRMHMHILLVFLSLLGGLDAFGPVGLILGPLLMTVFLTLVSIYRDHYRPLFAAAAAAAASGAPAPIPAAVGDDSELELELEEEHDEPSPPHHSALRPSLDE